MRSTLDLWFAVVAVALVFSGITRSALAVFTKITNQPQYAVEEQSPTRDAERARGGAALLVPELSGVHQQVQGLVPPHAS